MHLVHFVCYRSESTSKPEEHAYEVVRPTGVTSQATYQTIGHRPVQEYRYDYVVDDGFDMPEYTGVQSPDSHRDQTDWDQSYLHFTRPENNGRPETNTAESPPTTPSRVGGTMPDRTGGIPAYQTIIPDSD